MTQIIVTRQLEEEIKLFLDNYWKLYLAGDLQTWSTYLTDDDKHIGGSEEEIWNSQKEIMDSTVAVIDQMVGAVEFRNKKTEVFSLTPYILAHEFFDRYIKIGNDWVFYGKFRCSSIIKRSIAGWQVVHQHGSYPDFKKGKGEASAFDKISKENRELKDAIKRRTVELENKSRELEIESALEKVRTVAMAMRKPDDMLEICRMISQQSEILGIKEIRNVGTAIIYEDKGTYLNFEFYTRHAKSMVTEVDFKNHDLQKLFVNEMLHGAEELFTRSLTGEEIQDWYQYQQGTNQFADSYLEGAESLSYYWFSIGPVALGMSTYTPLSNEEISLFKRFRNVFDLAYRRFLDIEQAENQVREAKIQASLERVRAQALSMRKPDDLPGICEVLYTELTALGFAEIRNAMVNIHEDEKASFVNYDYSDEVGKSINHLKYDTHPLIEKQIMEIRSAQDAFSVTSFEKKDLVEMIAFRKKLGEKDDPRINNIDALYYYLYSIGIGSIGISTFGSITEEKLAVLKRFRNVFDFAYRRYTDVALAEAQAREAQIELALERVRARTLAMQKSEELSETVTVLFQQFHTLGERPERMAIEIVNEKENVFEIWATQHGGSQMDQLFKASLDEPYVMQKMYSAWKDQTKSITIDLQGKELEEYYQYLKQEGLPVQREIFGTRRVQNVATFSKGILTIITPETKPQETIDLLERFAIVFDGTYTRFLDLQKAESQVRQAQVEASLERVRSKTMAMHNSQEVGETVVALFDELVILGLQELDRCGIGIMHDQYIMEAWTASKADESQLVIGFINMKLHPLLQGTYEGWKNKKEAFQYILVGEDKLNYFQIINNQPDYRAQRDTATLPERVVLTDFYFNEGCLYAFSSKELSSETVKIFTRFAGVFGQTYRRYLDLQKAEAQAKEAIKASSLDRVRGEIASMRTVDDLQRITPLIWHELIALGVPFVRCGVFIVDETTAHVQVFLSAPDGHSLAALDLPFESSSLIQNAVKNWRKGLIYKTHWNKKEFLNWMQSMVRDGQVLNQETYQGAPTPPESLDLHFVPFDQGMLYVGNIQPLSTDELDLVKSLAEAFSIAYARYEDFKKLESAKQSIETTFSELKATQSQLVQSEKMASLGELTAGIAHEIQNPLNFVNNFSEVSTELVDEMNEEINNGNMEAAKEIAGDLRQNLEKISHHGKRAGDIVKGMLQHSRTSNGVTQPTNINALADEYLRLAYHGLRAKDKSFNAKMRTNFDQTIGMINVVPQDIGRVMLNLITNAFYAVDARKQDPKGFQNLSGLPDYEPTVSVTTENRGNQVVISVKDNGAGIPLEIRDKIFQPFFTTKPTGEGTGLGLSLSYDIVKAHGGEFKVETTEGIGSEFIIELPV